jgi:DNA-binding NarL/FixJ family response regulator
VDETKSILTVALDDETLERIAPLLKRRSLAVRNVAQAAEAETLARQKRFHLLICRYPLPDMKLREFVTSIRSESSASVNVSLLLLTIPEMATEARSGVRGGPFLVFSGQESLGTLGQGAAHLLKVAPRYAPRIPAKLETGLEEESESREGWLANLSRTGMLVTDAPMLPVGAVCAFNFKLPNGETVRGTGEVVRHTKPRRERITGFALRFVSFEPGSQEILLAWCDAVEPEES